MSYTLSNSIRTGIDDDGVPWCSIQDNGDFRRTIDFAVSGAGSKAGIIIQYIQKNTVAAAVNNEGKEVILNTSDAISKFTNNNVNFMCTSYLEYFPVSAKGLTYGDQFGNGAIAVYDDDGPILDREENISKGKIEQIGTSVFIPNGEFVKSIKQLGWNKSVKLPANGLPYLAFDEALWQTILANAKSNVLRQSVTITWGYGSEAGGKCVNCNPVLIKGGRKKTRKARK